MSLAAVLDLRIRIQKTTAAASELSGGFVGPVALEPLKRLALNAASTPAVTEAWADTFTLSSGAASLDLAALAQAGELADIDATGLKLQAIIASCPSTNTAAVLIEEGATNGYAPFGVSADRLSVPAGGSVMYYAPEGLADVASGVKTIDLSSSDLDATVSVLLLFG